MGRGEKWTKGGERDEVRGSKERKFDLIGFR